jgi:tetratricopeptide (TPR) repeat protein
MWDFDDPAGTEAKCRAVLPAFDAAGDLDLLLQQQTQIARTLSLRRKFDGAHALLDEVKPLLTEHTSTAHVRYLLERGRCFNSAGEKDKARPMFFEAWQIARTHKLDGLAVDAAHMLAIVETGEQAMAWNVQAMELAQASDQPKARKWLASLYNNIGWTHHSAGKFDEALACFEKALVEQEKKGDITLIRIAKWCIARCLRSLNRIDESLAMQQELLKEPDRDPTLLGYVHEELAECLHALGRSDDARPHFAKAYELLSQDEWLAKSEPERIERLRAMGGAD